LIRNLSKSSEVEIARNIEILGSECFSHCRSLSSITFESNSLLTRIESHAFSYSSLESIVIPRNVQFIDGSAFRCVTLSSISIESGNEMFVIEKDFLIDILHHKLIRNLSKSSEVEIARTIEIVGSNCFSCCKSLSSITFESDSLLTRIESEAFSYSSLRSILIPRNVEILGSECFYNCISLSSIIFESNSLLTRIEREAFSESSLQSILIPRNVEILCSQCFSHCESLSSITFESNSHLTRIERKAFSESSLRSILIPSSVEILGSKCFSKCKSLSSITFESNSCLTRIESKAFYESSVQSILIPSTILFVASNAVDIASQLSGVNGDSCPEFNRWLHLKISGITNDFRRIEKVGLGLRCLADYLVNLSIFEERSIICESTEISKEIYDRFEDELLVVMKSMPHWESIEESKITNELENLINLRHPCIAALIGFVFRSESRNPQELNIVRLYSEGSSLAEILSVNPVWWTSTVKAKAVAGIVLGLRFAHSLGLLHGHLTTSNILFDSDHCIQIVDFQSIPSRVGGNEDEEGKRLGSFSEEGWTWKMDVHGFASILFEIVVGRPAHGEISVPTDIRCFVSRIIETGLSMESDTEYSFHDIFEILKQNEFRIEHGVDSSEVSAFVSWIESAEQREK
jgi:predicted metal-binding protein